MVDIHTQKSRVGLKMSNKYTNNNKVDNLMKESSVSVAKKFLLTSNSRTNTEESK